MATNPILSAFPLANLMVKKITTKARMKSACPQNVAFRFIKFLIDELPEKHNTHIRGSNAWAKIGAKRQSPRVTVPAKRLNVIVISHFTFSKSPSSKPTVTFGAQLRIVCWPEFIICCTDSTTNC